MAYKLYGLTEEEIVISGEGKIIMHLAYFHANKFADDNHYFWVKGLLIPDKKAIELENTHIESSKWHEQQVSELWEEDRIG